MLSSLLNQTCMVRRLTTVIAPITNRPTSTIVILGPFICSVGKTSGSEIMMDPQMEIIKSLKVYLLPTADVKESDIIDIIGDNKYIVENVYKPRNHHIECMVTIKRET